MLQIGMKMVNDGNEGSVNPGQHQVICAEQEMKSYVLHCVWCFCERGEGVGGWSPWYM